MTESGITLTDLAAAYQRWGGPIVHKIQLRRKQDNPDLPSEIDLLFFQPLNITQLPPELHFTFIATAGMSSRLMQGSVECAEIILRVDGYWAPELLENLARKLAQIAVLPFLEGDCLGPSQILCNLTLPGFERMNCAWVTDWILDAEEFLPGLVPAVRLLNIKPLFDEEVGIVQTLGSQDAARLFFSQRINWYDPGRPSVQLERLHDQVDERVT